MRTHAKLASPLVVAAVSAALLGCSTPSVHPFINAPTAALPGVEGTWYGDDVMMVVERLETPPVYRAALDMKDGQGARTRLEIDARLLRTGGVVIADITVAEPKARELADAYAGLVVVVHMLYRVDLDDDRLDLAPLSEDWLGDSGFAPPPAGDMLTADPATLLGLARAAAAAPEAWSGPATLTRTPPEEDPDE